MKQWAAPAKLNLFLSITGRRPDNYHNLQTLFHFIDYCDYLTFTPRGDNEIHLLTEFADVKPDDNLIIRAAKLLLQHAQSTHLPLTLPYGVDITVDKKLPMGGGLGGGSSNAATTLVALNQLWQLNLPQADLMKMGRSIGADVPIFIFGQSAFAQGIGDELQPINLTEKWYLVAKPNIEIATAKIFNCPELKRDSVTKYIQTLLAEPFTNDCEATVRQLYPQIDSLITLLATKVPTRLTGTGSCVFSECTTEQQALALQNFLIQYYPSPITSFIAKGCNHSPLFNL